MNIITRFKNGWNAFFSRDPTYQSYGPSSSFRPYRGYVSYNGLRSIVSSIYNRIAVDVAAIDFRHVRLNDENNYQETMTSELNDCLGSNPNIDQGRQAFFVDVVESLINEGSVAIVPVDTVGENPLNSEQYDVVSMRAGRVTAWYPYDVRVDVYNERTGRHEEITLPKRIVPIIENPFYTTMNEPDSTLRRLIRVLDQLDRTNEQNSSNKLNMIIQFPYTVKNELKRKQAQQRRRELEEQLYESPYGIAYSDGTEKIVQLNRSLENNLWTQAKELTSELFNKLGMTESILNGTASEEELVNYHDRTIRPFCTAIAEEMERKWLSRTARTQKQAIRFFRDPFKIVPVKSLAEIADKFTRNEIMSSNELRAVIGLRPSDDPRADQLINANLNQTENDPRFEGKEETDITIDDTIKEE